MKLDVVSLNEALTAYTKGEKVIILQCLEDGQMKANLLSDFLEHEEDHFLIARTAATEVQTPDPEQIIQAVHDTQPDPEKEEDGEELPPSRSRRQ